MRVDSPMELYTTFYGWHFYDQLWDVLMGTGLAFAPFLYIIGKAAYDGYTSPQGQASDVAVREAYIRVIVAFTVIVLACQPMITLTGADLTHQPTAVPSDPNPPQGSVGNSGTTLDDTTMAANLPGSVRVPVLWYGVMAISSGINAALISAIPSEGELRSMQAAASTARIGDSALAAEAGDFYRHCFLPARSKYLREQPQDSTTKSILNKNGANDPDWFGSRLYQQLPGYYDTERAQDPVPNWPVNMSRISDQNYRDATSNGQNPPSGIPTCNEWWADSSHGLRTRLAAEGSQVAGWMDKIRAFSSISSADKQDILAKAVLNNSPLNFSGQMGGVGSSSSRETLIDKPLAAAGAMMAEPVARAVLIAMKIATPMIQAFLLMGIYFMMAGVLVLSSYNLKVVMIGAIAIFSVKFWTVLWAVAGWVDENLITAMFPERRALLESFLLSSAEWIASAGAAIGGMSGGGFGAMDHVTKRVILDLVMASMYVALPVLWTAMVGWAGYEVLSISRVGSTMGASTQKAGGAAAQTGVNVATRSIRPGK